jgi:hypothetical protein
MRNVRFGIGMAVTAMLVSCEPVIEPLADTVPEVPAPSFAVHGPVVQSVTGGAGFYWTQSSSGAEVWRTYSLSARKHADGSVTGTFQANYHGLWVDRGRITCFTIRGNEAWLGVVIESSTSPNPNRVNSERIIHVQDNGEGGGADPDLSTALPSLGDFESLDDYCTRAPLERPDHRVHELEAGNIQVFNPLVDISGSGGFHFLSRGGDELWRTFSLTAQKQADGSVTGHYQSNAEGDYNEGPITCFTIIGNEGWLGMIVEVSSNPDRVGEERIIYVQDNGEDGGTDPDRSTRLPPLLLTGLPDLDTYCAEPDIGASGVYDLEEGGIQIRR